MKTLGLAVPTFQRFEYVKQCVEHVLTDERVAEIALTDDCSGDDSFARLVLHFLPHPKVHLFRNVKNLDCYANKREAVSHCQSDWVILFDDDNILPRSYVDLLFRLPKWKEDVLYCPVFAQPHFDYRAFAGETITKKNVAHFLPRKHFLCALNTCNFFVHRASYLAVWNGSVNPYTADSIYFVSQWLETGRALYFVPDLTYFHRVHNGSHYKQNWRKTGAFQKVVERRLAQMH